MSADVAAQELLIWTDARRVALVREILLRMGDALQPIGVGGPRGAETADLARELDCDFQDDQRKLLIDRPASFVLIASEHDLGPSELFGAADQGAAVLELEPVAADFDDLAAACGKSKGAARGGRVMLPAFRQCPGWVSAANPNEIAGQPYTINMTSLGAPDAASFFARLYDAWDAVLAVAEMPNMVFATLSGPLPAPPQGLRGLTGAMHIAARLPDNQSAAIRCSDQSAISSRALHIIGDSGQVRISEEAYELYGEERNLLDMQPEPEESSSYIDLIVRQWTQLLSRTTGLPPMQQVAERDARILACCHACLLSARTATAESPRNILEMHGWG
jgi:hypothetical protein